MYKIVCDRCKKDIEIEDDGQAQVSYWWRKVSDEPFHKTGHQEFHFHVDLLGCCGLARAIKSRAGGRDEEREWIETR